MPSSTASMPIMFIGHPAETHVHRVRGRGRNNNDNIDRPPSEAQDVDADDSLVTQVLAAGRRVDDGLERWLPDVDVLSIYGQDGKADNSAGHPAAAAAAAAAAAGLLDITDGLSSLSSSATSCSSLISTSSPDGSSMSQTHVDKQQHAGKRKRPSSHSRPCAYLQPGMIFCGRQSFTAYPSSPYYRVAGDRLPQHHSHPQPHPHHHHHQQQNHHHHHHRHHHHNLARQAEQTRQASTWADAHFSRHHRTPIVSQPSSMHTTDLRPVAAYARELPSWETLNQPSAIDPQLQAMLAAAPSYYIPDRSHLPTSARVAECTRGLSHTEEWEVRVSISHVDYKRGRVRGIMKALNVPKSSSHANARHGTQMDDSSTTSPRIARSDVTTSFEGEIIDLHNHSLWTAASPPSRTKRAFDACLSADDIQQEEAEEEEEQEEQQKTDDQRPAWLSASAPDKSTDLEYWARLDAFACYGQNASKEICRIARQGKWTFENDGQVPLSPRTEEWQQSHPTLRRSSPQDYILMRWKEQDFIDCDAKSSGLTISGFYYLCLHRLTGALTGFYYDPTSTPHQRLSMNVATTDSGSGAAWSGTYTML